ncbi:MAG: MarR family transcriptional regulator [Proteobacteria bacterium]|nr:MarR family transcriptional regulator [Pseudomonadota bacterium]MBU1686950.1 MarR family transcriptional regulator [Pseudomonadota bacterium]
MTGSQCTNDSLGRLLYQTSLAMRNFAEKLLKPHDLTLEQLHLLKHLPEDQGLTQKELGERIHKTPANLTRILDRLETKGLLIRRINPDDRRAMLVAITPRGADLIIEMISVFESFTKKMVDGIAPQEEQVLRKTLIKIAANIEAMPRDAESS